MEKEFSFSEVLSATSGRFLCDEFSRLHELIEHVMGYPVFTHQIPDVSGQVKEFLVDQFPELDSPEMQIELGKLILMLDGENGKKNAELLISGWLALMTEKHGNSFLVKTSDGGIFYQKDPVDDAIEKFGKDKVIAVEIQ